MERKRRSSSRTEQVAHNKVINGLIKPLSKKPILPFFILFIACVGAVNAIRFGGASLDYYTVKNSVDMWINKGVVQSEGNYNAAKSSVQTAMVLHRSHPLYVELSAQIKEWGVVSGLTPDTSLQEAKSIYLAATTMRPLWPVTWANLAMLKWRLQEFDDEMLHYLNKADALGPQKSEVHLLFSQLGLTLYNANHPFYIKIKDKVHQRIKKGLRSHTTHRPLLTFIRQSNSKKTVCRWIDEDNATFINQVLYCPRAQ